MSNLDWSIQKQIVWRVILPRSRGKIGANKNALAIFENHFNSTAIRNENILHEICWKYYEKSVKNNKNPVR